MKIGKVLVAAVAVTVFDTVVGILTCGGVFNWVYKLEPTNVWKSIDGPPGAMMYIGSLILNILLVTVYVFIRKGIPGRTRIAKGIVFGLCVWVVGTLPGMFATYYFMTVATTVVVYWTILALIQTPLKGLIIAAMYGD
ncbi:hypothetical protein ACFL5X_03220 [Candidatus Omnitrophota bacterium]